MDAEGGTGEVSRRACISGTDGSACCLPDVLAGNVVLKGLRLINRAYREDIVISSASPIHSEGMGGVIDNKLLSYIKPKQAGTMMISMVTASIMAMGRSSFVPASSPSLFAVVLRS